MARSGPNVFSIAPGAPFLATLARALLDGELIEGFPGAGGPLALDSATVYLPTQRAAAAFAEALLAESGGASLILPHIAPLGAFEPSEEAGLLGESEDGAPKAAIPAAVGELTRRMTLARLTRSWGEALRGAIRRVGPDGNLVFDEREPALVAASPAAAFALAGDLAALIDDMIVEGVDWARLRTLAPEAYDPYWGITLQFLDIAMAAWPAWLAERGLVDRARRGALRVEAEVAALAAGAARGPTVVAGSTGANRATARLIGAVARAPQGAVVLPGLDLHLDDDAWGAIGAEGKDGETVAGHPQALLRRLLATIGVPRGEVCSLGAPPRALARRAALLGEALRPAETTDAWRRREGALADATVAEALAGVSIIVADTDGEEALALAVAMRETLETPGKTAALITPDPAIARRVAAELSRWGIAVEDSAGRTLGGTPAGALARLALAAALDFSPPALAALLRHPAARLGRGQADFDLALDALEIGLLRAIPSPGGLDDAGTAFVAAREAATSRHAHPALARLDDAAWRAAEILLADVARALAPLRRRAAGAPLVDWLDAHGQALATLAVEPGDAVPLAALAGGEALLTLLAEWRLAAEEGFPARLDDYAALFDVVSASQRAPSGGGGHPRLKILGLLEARLLAFNRTLIAGLDERVWPPAVEAGPFLNRPMRAELGLSAPERRIGQTAHDFVAAMGAGETILSRAKKRGGEPTVASRFLQRLGAAAGEKPLAEAEARGAVWLALARSLDRAPPQKPLKPPRPAPPLERRPKQLSVTRIETLRRDPYAIYAEYVLKLRPLAPIGAALDARAVGEAWHLALQRFAERHPSGDLPADARAELVALARESFAPLLADPAYATLAWPHVEAGIEGVLDFERGARVGLDRILVERAGRMVLTCPDGPPFELTARADRIDLRADGGARLIDYKSGQPPGAKEIEVGFAPQLTLEAAILAAGGFPGIAATPTGAAYVKLGGANSGKIREVGGNDVDFAALVAEHLAGCKALIGQFADPATPYLSRPYPKFASKSADYDHLARVREWSATGGESDGEEGGEA